MITRLAKFGVVGGSGVVVNMGIFALGMRWIFIGIEDPSIQRGAAGALAVIISILSNFALNDAWTWRDRRKQGAAALLLRLGKYAVVAGISGLIQLGVLATLSGPLGLDPYLSNLLGIAAGVVINFAVNNVWTFRQRSDTPLQPEEARPTEEDALATKAQGRTA